MGMKKAKKKAKEEPPEAEESSAAEIKENKSVSDENLGATKEGKRNSENKEDPASPKEDEEKGEETLGKKTSKTSITGENEEQNEQKENEEEDTFSGKDNSQQPKKDRKSKTQSFRRSSSETSVDADKAERGDDEPSEIKKKERRRSIATKQSSATGYRRQWGSLVNPAPKDESDVKTSELRNSLGSMLTDGKHDMIVATTFVQREADEVREKKLDWSRCAQAASREECEFMERFANVEDDVQKGMLAEHESAWPKTFANLLKNVDDAETLAHILVLLDDSIEQDSYRVEIFKKYAGRTEEDAWKILFGLLNHSDGFVQNMSARIIAKLACRSKTQMDRGNLRYFLTWLLENTKNRENKYVQSTTRCLLMMLKIDRYRLTFVTVNGIPIILTVLQLRLGFQIQYQLIFCLWLLTFNAELASRLNRYNIVAILSDILCDAIKEKVTRIILAVFRNLIEKPLNKQISKEHAIGMIQCKVLKHLSLLRERRHNDEELVADMKYLDEYLHQVVQEISSFDDYSTEVKSGRLQWSPVHRSTKFWRENAQRLNENKHELLRIMTHILETSNDTLVLCVACNDIGEYVRHFPKGKEVIDELGAKRLIMLLIKHKDPNLKYEALLAVQKIMVHHWEYLSQDILAAEDAAAGDAGTAEGEGKTEGKGEGKSEGGDKSEGEGKSEGGDKSEGEGKSEGGDKSEGEGKSEGGDKSEGEGKSDGGYTTGGESEGGYKSDVESDDEGNTKDK